MTKKERIQSLVDECVAKVGPLAESIVIIVTAVDDTEAEMKKPQDMRHRFLYVNQTGIPYAQAGSVEVWLRDQKNKDLVWRMNNDRPQTPPDQDDGEWWKAGQ